MKSKIPFGRIAGDAKNSQISAANQKRHSTLTPSRLNSMVRLKSWNRWRSIIKTTSTIVPQEPLDDQATIIIPSHMVSSLPAFLLPKVAHLENNWLSDQTPTRAGEFRGQYLPIISWAFYRVPPLLLVNLESCSYRITFIICLLYIYIYIYFSGILEQGSE
jgi:hypothetical protein